MINGIKNNPLLLGDYLKNYKSYVVSLSVFHQRALLQI